MRLHPEQRVDAVEPISPDQLEVFITGSDSFRTLIATSFKGG
jgi:hypothetical protein